MALVAVSMFAIVTTNAQPAPPCVVEYVQTAPPNVVEYVQTDTTDDCIDINIILSATDTKDVFDV